MRSIWKGHIRFSLVTIPVRVYNAIDTAQTIHFNQLHRECNGPIGYDKRCKKCNQIVKNEEIVKGYQYEPEQYVVVEPADLEKLKLASTKIIEIEGFVHTAEVHPTLYEAAKQMGLEGIMAKERRSPYLPGKRSASWLKIKTRNTTECVIIGYTRGKGDRAPLFGALHLGRYDGDRLRYVGKVGTGFDDRLLKTVFKELKGIPQGPRPVETRPVDDASTVWLEPRLVCEVEYASLTTERTLREPVFLRLRPDLDPGDCVDS